MPDTALMTEIVLPGVVAPEGLVVRTRPIPSPGRGQALVRMLATGVSFAENSMRRNRYPGQPKFPFVPGYDLVGEVVAVGDGVDSGLVGSRVAAVTRTGSWSSHVVLGARSLLAVPETADPAEVETVLLNGITAWQMLHRSARARDGQTILVHGASGGVGTILLQLARHAGMRVIATASPRNHDLVRELGAEPLDYHHPALAEQVRRLAPGGVDAAFDNIGGDSFARSFSALAPSGTLVGYGTASQRDGTDNLMLTFAGVFARFTAWSVAPNHGRSATFYNFWAGSRITPRRFHARQRADLDRLLSLLAAGVLIPRVAHRFALARSADALALADRGVTQGKIIIEP